MESRGIYHADGRALLHGVTGGFTMLMTEPCCMESRGIYHADGRALLHGVTGGFTTLMAEPCCMAAALLL